MNLQLAHLFLAARDPVATEWPEFNTAFWQIALVVFLVLLNGFFVAAEFAIVKVRGTQVDEAVEEEKRGAQTTRHIVDHLDVYLSATQLGITMASVLLSMFGERYISKLIEPIFPRVGLMLSEGAISIISFCLAFAFITAIHVVIGELMPKSLAIRKSLPTALMISGPLRLFQKIFGWANTPLTALANRLLRVFFRMDGVTEHSSVHSGSELQMLVEESERNKHVTDLERDISINALELNERLARDIMTPRTEIVHMDLGKTFEENLQLAMDSKHTRFPIREGTLDNVPGIIHIKDLLRVVRNVAPTDLLKIARQPLWISEIQPLDEVLRSFLQKQAHMALVVDENGVLTGMLTLDDVLEEIVGEIRDEFDVHDEERFRIVAEDEFLVEGKFPLYELGEFIPDMELEMANVSTITGYITSKLNRLPQEGDVVEMEDSLYEAKVEKVEGRRVAQVRIRKKTEVAVEKATNGVAES